MKSEISKLLHDAADVIFPRSCVHCGGLADGGRLRHLCDRCEKYLRIVHGPRCTTCGHPFDGVMVADEVCLHCSALRPVFGEGRTAVVLKGAGRSLVHSLKYHAGLHVLEDIETVFATAPGFADYLSHSVLVPVPLHPRKLREREYNQSLLIAECCARAAGGGTRVEELLQRIVDTESQTRFDRAERQANLKNAFALARGATIEPSLRYLLVDDVFTTGATLNACASVLRRAGCLNIDVVTFGHG